MKFTCFGGHEEELVGENLKIPGSKEVVGGKT